MYIRKVGQMEPAQSGTSKRKDLLHLVQTLLESASQQLRIAFLNSFGTVNDVIVYQCFLCPISNMHALRSFSLLAAFSFQHYESVRSYTLSDSPSDPLFLTVMPSVPFRAVLVFQRIIFSASTILFERSAHSNSVLVGVSSYHTFTTVGFVALLWQIYFIPPLEKVAWPICWTGIEESIGCSFHSFEGSNPLLLRMALGQGSYKLC